MKKPNRAKHSPEPNSRGPLVVEIEKPKRLPIIWFNSQLRTPARINQTAATIEVYNTYFSDSLISVKSKHILMLHEAMIEFHPDGCHESWRGVTAKNMANLVQALSKLSVEEKEKFYKSIGRK